LNLSRFASLVGTLALFGQQQRSITDVKSGDRARRANVRSRLACDKAKLTSFTARRSRRQKLKRSKKNKYTK